MIQYFTTMYFRTSVLLSYFRKYESIEYLRSTFESTFVLPEVQRCSTVVAVQV